MAELAPWLWLGGSFLLAIVATQAAWWLWNWERGKERLAPFAQSTVFPFLLQLTRFVYYLGLPLAALIWGHDAVVRSLLGLQSLNLADPADWINWAQDAGWAAGLGLAAWAVLALGWLALRRAGTSVPEEVRTPVWVMLRDAAFHEVHWAFYRNAPILALRSVLDEPALYHWGAWGGFALIALESVFNPWWGAELQSQERRPAALLRVGLALLSAALYVQARNLWLAVLVHWGVTWGLAVWVRLVGTRRVEKAQ